MFGGLRGAKAASKPFIQTPGIAPMFYRLSGEDQRTAAQEEAQSLGRQSLLSYEDSLAEARYLELEAQQTERRGRAFKEEQALNFAHSGVTLEGSPLGILEETSQLVAQEASFLRRRGTEQVRRGLEVSRLLEMEGLQMLRRGSAAAFSGFAQALQSEFETSTRNRMAEYEAKTRSQQMRDQAIQSGFAGLQAGVQGIGSLFGSRSKNP